MSITVNQSPQVLSPAFNELTFLVLSTNVAQTNFRYVFDIYDAGLVSRLARVKVAPRPSDTRGLFDLSRLIQSYLKPYIPVPAGAAAFNPATSAVSPFMNQILPYRVELGENFSTLASGEVTYILTSVSGIATWYGGLPWTAFAGTFYDYNNYILTKGGSSGSFLTNAPLTQDIELFQNYYLLMLVNPSGAASAVGRATLKKYNSAGTLLGTLNISNIYAQTYGMFVFPCGPANINVASSNWIDSNVSYYTVQIDDSTNTKVSQLLTFNMQTQCRYQTYRLHWLNSLGGYDSFNFTMKTKTVETLERSSFRKRYGSTSGTSWSYSKLDRGKTQFETRTQKKLTLNTDWLSDVQSSWLEELFSSPCVFMEFYNGDSIIAVNLTANNYEIKIANQDKLFQWTLELEFAHENIRQRQ